jgi:hypothetical protein
MQLPSLKSAFQVLLAASRVLALASFILALSAPFLASRAQAALRERLALTARSLALGFGSSLESSGTASNQGGSLEQLRPLGQLYRGQLFVNGLDLTIETGSRRATLAETIAALEAACPGGSTLPGGLGHSSTRGRTFACFAPRTDEAAGAWPHRWERFLHSWDPRALGSPQVAFLEDISSSRGTATQVIRLQLDRLPDASIFPKHGDAPGIDPSFAPRPSGRRILSAIAIPTPRSSHDAPRTEELTFIYEMTGAPELAVESYLTSLPEPHYRIAHRSPNGRVAAVRTPTETFLVVGKTRDHGSALLLVRYP